MSSLTGMIVATYARVSTIEQADNNLSIPDQVERSQRYIDDNGGTRGEVYIEPGASATTTARRVYQQMLEDARAGKFDAVAIFALSRMFRNALDYLQARAEFKAVGIKLISITQDFSDDPAGELALSMVSLFDEYHSKENAKHVKRSMLANARQGYWNGQTPPLGYKSVAVPQPKGKDRRKLVVDEETAYLPRFIFQTYLDGTKDGPIGITKLAHLLNERGETIRGRKFHVSNVHAILTNTAYIGIIFFNKRDSKAKAVRPESEWVPVPVPALIDEDLFYQAQSLMTSRDPKMGKNADKTNGNLLTKKVVCGTSKNDGCCGGMTTGTGGSGRHRYYVCHNSTKAGKTVCKGRWTPMEKLDSIVIENITEHVLQPDRLSSLLEVWLKRSSAGEDKDRGEIKVLRSRLTMLDGESANVISLVRKGFMKADDPQIEKELGQIAAQKRAVCADLDILERKLADPARGITPKILEQFGALVSDTLRQKSHPLRRAYVDLLVSRVEVGDDIIRITGSKTSLARAASGARPHRVPKAEREWCTRQDSNQWPLPSKRGNIFNRPHTRFDTSNWQRFPRLRSEGGRRTLPPRKDRSVSASSSRGVSPGVRLRDRSRPQHLLRSSWPASLPDRG